MSTRPVLHLDDGEHRTQARDEIDFKPAVAEVPFEDLVAAQSEEGGGQRFGVATAIDMGCRLHGTNPRTGAW